MDYFLLLDGSNSRCKNIGLLRNDVIIQVIITSSLLGRVKRARPRLGNDKPHALEHLRPSFLCEKRHVGFMRHKDRLDTMRTLAIRVILFGSSLTILGAKNAQKEVPAWLDPIEEVSSHAGDARAVEAKKGEDGRGPGECSQASGVIEHIALLKCSLGNLLLAQLDHCRGEIDTVGFTTAFCDHG